MEGEWAGPSMQKRRKKGKNAGRKEGQSKEKDSLTSGRRVRRKKTQKGGSPTSARSKEGCGREISLKGGGDGGSQGGRG